MVGMIHKKMSSYVHTLALIGTLLSPTIVYPASVQNSRTPTAHEIVHGGLIGHMHNLLESAEFLQKLLEGKIEAFTLGLQRLEPKDKKRVEKLCADLSKKNAILRHDIDQLKTSLLQQDKRINNEKVWQLTAGLLRFYDALHTELQDNLKQSTSKSNTELTVTDTKALELLKFLEERGKQYEEELKKAPSGDTTALKKLVVKTIGLDVSHDKLTEMKFSVDQQMALKKIDVANKNFKRFKKEIDVLIEDLGRTQAQKTFKELIYDTGGYYHNKWQNYPEFRTKVALYTLGAGAAIFTLSSVGILPAIIAAKVKFGAEILTGGALAAVGSSMVHGFGAKAGMESTRITNQAINDIFATAKKKAAEWAKISGEKEVVLMLPSGTKVRKIVPNSAYDVAILNTSDDSYKRPTELFQDILTCLGKTEAEITSLLKDRTKTMIYQGPKGSGKTYTTQCLINIYATELAKHGIPLHVVEFTADGIINNDMMLIELAWAASERKSAKGRFFYVKDFGEFELAIQRKPEVKELLLKEFEHDREEGHTVITFGTTNRTEKNQDGDLTRAGRAFEFQMQNPNWETRKAFFNKHLKERLYFTSDSAYYRLNNIPNSQQHYEVNLNTCTTLSHNASMAQLNQIIGNLDTQRTRGVIITPKLIEEEILREVYRRKNSTDGSQFNPAVAVHYAGQYVTLLQNTDEQSLQQGTCVAITSAQIFETELDPKSRVRTDVPGRLIWASKQGNKNEKSKLKQLASGYLAQEILIKNPQDRDLELIKRDRIALREECEKYLAPGYDLQKMPPAEQAAHYKLIQDEIKKIETEVRTELSKAVNLLYGTTNHIAQRGQITGVQYLALLKQLTEAEKKKNSPEDTSADKKPLQKQAPVQAKPPVAALAAAQKR